MILLILLAILCVPASTVVLPYVFMAIAFFVFFEEAGVQLNVQSSILLVTLCLLFPLSLFLMGKLLDRYSFDLLKARFFVPVAMLLGFYLLLDGGVIWQIIDSVILASSGAAGGPIVHLVLQCVNGMFFAAIVAAFAFTIFLLCVEFPLQWFLSGAEINVSASIAAVRPVLVLLVASIAFDLLTGLFTSELNILKLLSGA